MPEVWVRRWRNVIGFLAGRVVTVPSAPMPTRTSLRAISGTMSAAGVSRPNFPRSTICIAAAPVMALVMEAIQITLSDCSVPAAPSKIVPSALAATAATPGTSPASTACFKPSAMLMRFLFACRRDYASRVASSIKSCAAMSRSSSSAVPPSTCSRPISSSTGTASGEMRSSRR